MGLTRKYKKALMQQRMKNMDVTRQVEMVLSHFRRAGLQVEGLADVLEATNALLEQAGLPVPAIEMEQPVVPPPMILTRAARPARFGHGHGPAAVPAPAPAVPASLPSPSAPKVVLPRAAAPRALPESVENLLDGAFGSDEEPEAAEAPASSIPTQQEILAKFNARIARAEREGVHYGTGGGRSRPRVDRDEQLRLLQQGGIGVGDPKPSPVPKPQV